MKDYAKIAKDVRMQEKLAEKQTIQAFVQKALPEICSEAIQEAERIAQAGEIYFPLDVDNYTDGLNGEYGEKAFRTLYRATQKELRRRNLYLLDGTVYFRRRTFFGPLLLVTLIKVCFGASLLYMVVFNYWVGLVLTVVFGMALLGIYTYEERQDEQ